MEKDPTKTLSVGISDFGKVSLDIQLEKLDEDLDSILYIFSKPKCSLFPQLGSLQFSDQPSQRLGPITHRPRIR